MSAKQRGQKCSQTKGEKQTNIFSLCPDDRVAKTGRRSERHRNWNFRRLVAKRDQVEESCAPLFALSTRARTDCVDHVIRSVTERQPDLTVLSNDGIGAYDHVYRSSIMAKLHEMPGLRKLLPFVRRPYSRPSRYSWVDGQRERHWIQQHEGREQGDPLSPLLFSLAIHDALCEVSGQMQEGELLFA